MTDLDSRDEIYMKEALRMALEAESIGEVPIGAVIVYNNEIIASAKNERETDKNALRHAEITAIDEACRRLGSWRLSECTLYVTLEPCPMCAGAIVNSRISRVVFGAKDPKAGAFGSVLQFNSYPLNHKPEIVSGVLEDECRMVLSEFFIGLRTLSQDH